MTVGARVGIGASEPREAGPAARLLDRLGFGPTPGQIPALDGLRALAIVLVVLRHAAHNGLGDRVSIPVGPGIDLGTFMLNGWVGVDLFFVLSGFLIARHILALNARMDGAWPWKTYLARRALRIVPAYYAVLFLAVAGAFPFYEIDGEGLGLRVAYHLLFLQDYLPANIVVPFWSLGVEEKFYLVAPMLVLAGVKGRSMARGMIAVVGLLLVVVLLRSLVAFARPEVATYEAFFFTFRSPFHMTLDPILIGVLLAFVHASRETLPRVTAPQTARIVFWLGAAGALALLFGSELMAIIGPFDKTLQPLAIALVFGAITFGLLFGGGPGLLFEGPALRFLARISYSLYLVHVPLIPLCTRLAGADESAVPSLWPFLAAYLPVSIGGALLIHFAIERPFLELKERLT